MFNALVGRIRLAKCSFIVLFLEFLGNAQLGDCGVQWPMGHSAEGFDSFVKTALVLCFASLKWTGWLERIEGLLRHFRY